MPTQTVELTESYVAVDDSGAPHMIHVHTAFVHHIMFDGSSRRRAGLKTHSTTNGKRVIVSDDGTLVELETGRKLYRV